jgi:hypothetical protein
MSTADAMRSITRSKKQVMLKNVGGTWRINEHDGLGEKAIPGLTVTHNYYDPPFSVRSFNLVDTTEVLRNIHYDQAGDGMNHNKDTEYERKKYTIGIIETFGTCSLQPVHVTRVYLDEFTTATEIHLHG